MTGVLINRFCFFDCLVYLPRYRRARSNHVYVSVIHGHDQGSLLPRTMDRAMPPSVRVLYAEMPANKFSTGALEAVLDLWANKTIVACLLLIPEPVGSMPALTATNYRIPVLWLPSVQRIDQVSLCLFTMYL